MIKANIADTCGKTMQMYAPLIEHQVAKMTNNGTVKGKPFQILGFDLLIDEKLKAWILEINDHPSLNIYFDKEYMSVKKMEESDICQVDLYVKAGLVTDVVKLAKKRLETVQETDELGGLHRIHPSSGEPDAEEESEHVY